MDIDSVKKYAFKCHEDAKCCYDGNEYSVHLEDVARIVDRYNQSFKIPIDRINTYFAAFCHDLIEDARQSYNDIAENSSTVVADIVLAVSDVPSTNRLMKHLLTMGKTVQDYRAIVLKLCDILANATYSYQHGDPMYKKYKKEYSYRKPIFQQALSWYTKELDLEFLSGIWKELDDIFQV
ncbi:MAG: HD domain-containing protein [Dehalococcoidia bacterium]|jgi:(p)ppGpp synthase/HD superfamily hydrolase